MSKITREDLELLEVMRGDWETQSQRAAYLDILDERAPALLAAAKRAEKMEKALTQLAEEHERQAFAWSHGEEDGDTDNAKYHAGQAAIARAALAEGEKNVSG